MVIPPAATHEDSGVSPSEKVLWDPISCFRGSNNMNASCGMRESYPVEFNTRVGILHLLSSTHVGINETRTNPDTAIALLPNMYLAPYDSGSTLHFVNSFWGLFLPITLQGGEDILRSLVSQKLMWDCGLTAGFIGKS